MRPSDVAAGVKARLFAAIGFYSRFLENPKTSKLNL
jgi:hypothetical protein